MLLQKETLVLEVLFVLCLFVNFLYAGVLFGWAPLQLLLIKDEVFVDRCEDGYDSTDGDSCTAQLELINLLYTVGSTASIIGSMASGIILDNYGFITNCSIAGIFSFTGYLMFALAPRESLPVLIVAVTLIGLGGIFSFFCAFGIIGMVHKTNIPLILTGANVLFDCSAIIPLFYYELFEAGYSRRNIFLSYSLLACLVYMCYMFAYHLAARSYGTYTAADPALQINQEGDDVGGENNSVSSENSDRSVVFGVEVPHKEHRRRKRSVSNSSDITEVSQIDKVTVQNHDAFLELPWTEQLKSYYFLYIVCFTTVMMLRSNIYLGTVQILLEEYNDDDHGYLFTQIFTAILPFGFVFITSISYVLKRYGFATFNNIVTCLGIIYGVLAVIPVLYLQVLTFIFFCAYRAFFYSVVATFNASIFGHKNAGRIHGFSFLVAGIANFIQWPMMLLIFEYANGKLFYLYLALVLICIPSFFHTELYLRPAILRDKNDVIEVSPKEASVAGETCAEVPLSSSNVEMIHVASTHETASSVI